MTMRDVMAHERRTALSAFLLFFMLSAELWAQSGTQPKPGTSSGTGTDSTLAGLIFQIRPAFTLSMEMVNALQAQEGSVSGSSKAQANPEILQRIDWGQTITQVTQGAAPLDVKILGTNIVVLMQIFPVETSATKVSFLVQGQVWAKMPDNSLSYKTTVQTLSLAYGSRLYYYPLGIDAKAGAPLAVEIQVKKQSSH